MTDFPVTEAFVGSVNAAQLHDEARGDIAVADWPASFVRTDDGWVYRVERPQVDRAAVQAALDNHTPDPNYGVPEEDRQLRAIRAKAREVAAGTGTFTPDQVQKILARLVLRATR